MAYGDLNIENNKPTNKVENEGIKVRAVDENNIDVRQREIQMELESNPYMKEESAVRIPLSIKERQAKAAEANKQEPEVNSGPIELVPEDEAKKIQAENAANQQAKIKAQKQAELDNLDKQYENVKNTSKRDKIYTWLVNEDGMGKNQASTYANMITELEDKDGFWDSKLADKFRTFGEYEEEVKNIHKWADDYFEYESARLKKEALKKIEAKYAPKPTETKTAQEAPKQKENPTVNTNQEMDNKTKPDTPKQSESGVSQQDYDALLKRLEAVESSSGNSNWTKAEDLSKVETVDLEAQRKENMEKIAKSMNKGRMKKSSEEYGYQKEEKGEWEAPKELPKDDFGNMDWTKGNITVKKL